MGAHVEKQRNESFELELNKHSTTFEDSKRPYAKWLPVGLDCIVKKEKHNFKSKTC